MASSISAVSVVATGSAVLPVVLASRFWSAIAVRPTPLAVVATVYQFVRLEAS